MIAEITISSIPNQTTSFSIRTDLIELTLETRLENIFATVKQNGEYLVCNRICRNLTYICRWLVFIDIEGNSDPEYSGLGSRYKLVWNDEI
ncbi:phage baseplate plug family protein [Xenorhabdus anantnagensis]|uniref:phage baseplate plug family protein n=1 Tax=Xenorhabdus anantnagensis TaxID=3025875 RepID=UPI003F9A33F0